MEHERTCHQSPKRYNTSTMDFFHGPHYRINKCLLSFLGLWPLQNRKERYFFRALSLFLVWSIFIPKLIKFSECLGDANGMINCLPVLSLHVRCLLKFFNSIINAKKMRTLTTTIKENWETDENELTAKLKDSILKRYADRGRLLTIIYSGYLFSALFMYLTVPVIPIFLDVFIPLNETRERIFLYETEYFVDPMENYFYILVHAYISMPFCIGTIIAFDAMFAVYVHHICGIFAILGAQLENIRGTCDKNTTTFDKSLINHKDEPYNDIVYCIRMHKKAIEYSNLIESSSCMCFLFVIGVSLAAISLCGFMTVTNLDRPDEVLRHGTFALGELLHLFYLCWQGQILMEHSELIFLNAYNSNWYELSPRAKKLLILIMLRSLEPCKVTGGKIFIFSLENFTTALKTSMSYFTVLLAVQ